MADEQIKDVLRSKLSDHGWSNWLDGNVLSIPASWFFDFARSLLSASGQAVSEKAVRDATGSLRPTYEQLEQLYEGQCALTDQVAAKLEAGSDKTLLARIAELEADLATMNRRYADLQSTPAQQTEAPVNVPSGLIEILREAAKIISGEANNRYAIVDELEGFACMLAAAPAPVQTEAQQSEKDAERYRKVRALVGAMRSGGWRQVFHLEHLEPIEGANLMKGSVAQHFEEAIDAAIAKEKAKS